MIRLGSLAQGEDEEDRLTHYEELGVERKDLHLKYAVRLWPLVVCFFISWCVLLCVSAAAECATEAFVEGPRCAISGVATQWGSLIHANVVIALVSFGLYFKNGRARKTPCVLAFLCYVVSLVDVLVIRKYVPADALGIPSIGILLMWMIAVNVDVSKAVHSRILTRGRRKKMPRALITVTCGFLVGVGVMCALRFSRQAIIWCFLSWIFLLLCAIAYMVLITIHLRKVKIVLFNGAT